jgi:2'-5' RNA ligase
MSRNYAISADLTGEALAAGLELWDELEREFGCRAAKAARRPHVTFVVGAGDKPGALQREMEVAAAEVPPLEVVLDGLGTFPGPQPVVFLKVERTPALASARDRFERAMTAAGFELWPHYGAELWVPHMTLALQDTSEERLAALLGHLRGRRLGYTTRLEAVDLVHVLHPFHDYLATTPLRGVPHGAAPR